MNDRAVDVIVPGIQWQSSVEVGEKQGKMHTHIWVTMALEATVKALVSRHQELQEEVADLKKRVATLEAK